MQYFDLEEPHYVNNRCAVLRMTGATRTRAAIASPLSRDAMRTKQDMLKLTTAGYMGYSEERREYAADSLHMVVIWR